MVNAFICESVSNSIQRVAIHKVCLILLAVLGIRMLKKCIKAAALSPDSGVRKQMQGSSSGHKRLNHSDQGLCKVNDISSHITILYSQTTSGPHNLSASAN